MYGLKLDILHTLSSIDIVNLLGAAAYAGASRHTKAGDKLYKTAKSHLMHEITNDWMQGGVVEQVNEEDEMRNLDRIMRSTYAQYVNVENDVLYAYKLHDEAPILSIDKVLPAIMNQPRFMGAMSGVEDAIRVIAGVERVDSYESEPGGFTSIAKEEAHRRLTDIDDVDKGLRGAFGDNITISYKTLTPTLDNTTRELYEQADAIRRKKDESDKESDFGAADFSDYIFIEVAMPDGETYVIADSPDYANACYVVRSDVMRAMGALLGREMTWTDALRYPKETARQLGVARFNHTQESDTFGKAINRMNESLDGVLKSIAKVWCDSETAIFDDEMKATKYNRLPRHVREYVTENGADVLDVLLEWLDANEETRAKSFLGKQALHGVNEPESSPQEDEDVQLRQQLILRDEELRSKEEENTRLRSENERLKRMLHALVDGVQL
jgi:hypothetical protein